MLRLNALHAGLCQRPPVILMACGNPSRGDDALGPLLLGRLRSWLAQQGLAMDFELITEFQLQIENALDLVGRRMALFLDAGEGTPSPFCFHQVAAASCSSLVTHSLSPAEVLAVLSHLDSAPPPPVFILCLHGERFNLGDEISASAAQNAEQAFALLTRLCANPTLTFWQNSADPVSG